MNYKDLIQKLQPDVRTNYSESDYIRYQEELIKELTNNCFIDEDGDYYYRFFDGFTKINGFGFCIDGILIYKYKNEYSIIHDLQRFQYVEMQNFVECTHEEFMQQLNTAIEAIQNIA